MKKVLISVIAIVLVATVVGACFAQFYQADNAATVVNITTSFQSFTLQIKNGANTALIGNTPIDFAALSPSHRTEAVDITLAVNDSTYIDGNKGVLNVSLTGDLAEYITTTVTLLDAAQGDPIAEGANITAAATGAGYKALLSATPIFVRLSFYLNDAGCTNFAAAELTASLSVTWEVDNDSVWSYSGTEYYLVGKINGDATKWAVTEANQNVLLTKVNEGNNIAIATGVALTAGDEIKVVYNYNEDNGTDPNSIWYGTGEGGDNSQNVAINTTGTYNIYLYSDTSNGGVYKVSAALQE